MTCSAANYCDVIIQKTKKKETEWFENITYQNILQKYYNFYCDFIASHNKNKNTLKINT